MQWKTPVRHARLAVALDDSGVGGCEVAHAQPSMSSRLPFATRNVHFYFESFKIVVLHKIVNYN